MNDFFTFKYSALEKLNNINKLLDNSVENVLKNKFYLCIFNIIISEIGIHPPFLQFLLEMDCNKILTFPTLDLMIHLENTIKSILKKLYKDELSFIIHGYYQENQMDKYIFIEILNLKKINGNIIENLLYFSTIHEISNLKTLENHSINKKIYHFFIKNYDFLFLQNQNNIDYEIPIIAYKGLPFSKLEYIFVFGNEKSDYKNNYFLLSDFDKAKKDILLIKGKKGIVKFALFTGKIQIIEKLIELEKDFLSFHHSNNIEIETIQINLPETIYFIKNLSQQIPLSFQIINE